MLILAHAADAITGVLYIAPMVVVVAVLAFKRRRERRLERDQAGERADEPGPAERPV